MSGDEDIAVTAVYPFVGNPDGIAPWSFGPMAGYPDIAAALVNIMSGDPDMAWRRSFDNDFPARRRRRFLDNNLFALHHNRMIVVVAMVMFAFTTGQAYEKTAPAKE